MHQRSSISLCKFLSGHLFQRTPIPTSPNVSKPLRNLTNRCNSNPVSPPKAKNIHTFLNPTPSNTSSHFRLTQNKRHYSVDTDKEVDEINFKFAEAREEIDMALDSKETVYFDEEAECARIAVQEVLDMYEGLLAKLPESEKAALQRSMGLKIEQLKAELEQLHD
ncbi:hypothetical protein RJ639_004782 [Escallonia herrerae]|uniref:Late embryogenesis abundant protein n=1 Tax=Escallonia herrerae TaxID=1293975 RepID=A0AA88W1E9_9ASTE|nr:hypothetical protein RJ639_004782 [Escallonia herrerae]